MPADERYEGHLIDDRLVGRKFTRPAGCKRWHFWISSPTLASLLSSPAMGPFSIRKGQLPATGRVDAVRYYNGLPVDPKIPDIGPEILVKIAQLLGAHIQKCVGWIGTHYPQFAEEKAITGFLKGLLERERFISVLPIAYVRSHPSGLFWRPGRDSLRRQGLQLHCVLPD